MNFKKTILTMLVGTFIFTSCEEDQILPIQDSLGDYDNGVVVLNQGNFGQDNSDVSFISNDFESFENNFFSIVNPNRTMGNTGQDIGFYNNFAYIVLNGSNKIEVVDRYTFKHVTTISGFNNPRYIAFANGRAYVTNWGVGTSTTDDYVAVLNLDSNQISSTIPVAEGPERIVEKNNSLYVLHTGGFGYGKTVSIINSLSNTLTTTINVGDVPNALKIQGDFLYIICGGNPSFVSLPEVETAGSIVKINTLTNTVATTINFTDLTHPSNIDIAGNDLYYTVNENVFKMSVTATTLPTTPFFTTTSQGVYGVYSFEIENESIFVGDAGDYNSNGKVYIYSLASGTLQKSFTVGVIPAGFYFN